jgi:pectate lyase
MVRAADFYVGVDGVDTNPGTLERPFQTLKRGEQAASAGDTVYVRGGVYRFSGAASAVGVSFTKSGAADRPIRYFA